jgi:glyoxylase-like metal-dependent hydrolase (beta-lactamase superfamily II)
VVITHGHADHFAGLHSIAALGPRTPEILMSEREARLLAGDLAPLAGEPAVPTKPRGYGVGGIEPSSTVASGQAH